MILGYWEYQGGKKYSSCSLQHINSNMAEYRNVVLNGECYIHNINDNSQATLLHEPHNASEVACKVTASGVRRTVTAHSISALRRSALHPRLHIPMSIRKSSV
jgi:hypothetical protein